MKYIYLLLLVLLLLACPVLAQQGGQVNLSNPKPHEVHQNGDRNFGKGHHEIKRAVVLPDRPSCPKMNFINCMPPCQEKYRYMCGHSDWIKEHCPGVHILW